MAAAFNTPLAGIVFAIEELSRSFESRTSGLVVTTIIAAGLTSLALVGDYSYFGRTAARLPFGSDWLAVAICGVLGGLAGGLFSRIVIAFGRGLPGRVGAWIARHPGRLRGPVRPRRRRVRAPQRRPRLRHRLRAGAGAAARHRGGSRGLRPGEVRRDRAVLGQRHPGRAVRALPRRRGWPRGRGRPAVRRHAAGALVLIGMVAYLAGTLRAPITAFVIVSEMTETHAMMIPLMIAALVADGTAKLVSPHGLYHALAAQIVARAAPGDPDRKQP